MSPLDRTNSEDEEPLSEELARENDELEEEIELTEEAHANFAGGAAGVRSVRHQMGEDEAVAEREREAQQEEISDYVRLDDELRKRPSDRVEVFDFKGEHLGVGLRDAVDEGGRSVIRVPADMLDVAARIESADGPSADVSFRRI